LKQGSVCLPGELCCGQKVEEGEEDGCKEEKKGVSGGIVSATGVVAVTKSEKKERRSVKNRQEKTYRRKKKQYKSEWSRGKKKFLSLKNQRGDTRRSGSTTPAGVLLKRGKMNMGGRAAQI